MRRRSSRVLIFGIVLVAMGIGNFWMGSAKLDQYATQMAEAVRAGGPDVQRPSRGTASILEPRTEAQDQYTNATYKYEYYRVVYRGGILLLAIGVVLVTGALIRRVAVPNY